MPENGSLRWPAAGPGIPPPFREREHASPTLKRIFNEIISPEDADAGSRRYNLGPPLQLPDEMSVVKPACKSRCLSQQLKEQLINSGHVNPMITVKQDKAQLTIFYAGTVNVYDDVPADKVHAITLLAGNSIAGPINRNNNSGAEFMAAQELLGTFRFAPFLAETKPQLVKRSHKACSFMQSFRLPERCHLLVFWRKGRKGCKPLRPSRTSRSFQVITLLNSQHRSFLTPWRTATSLLGRTGSNACHELLITRNCIFL